LIFDETPDTSFPANGKRGKTGVLISFVFGRSVLTYLGVALPFNGIGGRKGKCNGLPAGKCRGTDIVYQWEPTAAPDIKEV
jgi:hypothetical protein